MLCPGCRVIVSCLHHGPVWMQCLQCYCYYSLNGKYRRRVLITQPGLRCKSLFKHTERRVGARAVDGRSLGEAHPNMSLQTACSHQRGTTRDPQLLCCVPHVSLLELLFTLASPWPYNPKIKGLIYSLKFKFCDWEVQITSVCVCWQSVMQRRQPAWTRVRPLGEPLCGRSPQHQKVNTLAHLQDVTQLRVHCLPLVSVTCFRPPRHAAHVAPRNADWAVHSCGTCAKFLFIYWLIYTFIWIFLDCTTSLTQDDTFIIQCFNNNIFAIRNYSLLQ